MAGTNPGFDRGEFIDAIHFVMEMGAPAVPEDQVRFYFPDGLVYNITDTDEVDDDNIPFDPEATVTPTTPDPVQVDCAVEYVDAAGQVTRVGDVSPSHVRILLLDEDYAQVQGCSYIVIAGERYDYDRTVPPKALFNVGIYEMFFTSRGEL